LPRKPRLEVEPGAKQPFNFWRYKPFVRDSLKRTEAELLMRWISKSLSTSGSRVFRVLISHYL
jgi:hypothetical protein